MSDPRETLTMAGARALLVHRAERLLVKTRPWEGRGGGRSGGSSATVSERQAVMLERDREQLRSELRGLRIAAAQAGSLAEIANYVRYRVGVMGPGNTWRARDFGERLLEQLDGLPKLIGEAESEAESPPSVMELARVFVGFLNRAYQYHYAIAGAERSRAARGSAGRRGEREVAGQRPRSSGDGRGKPSSEAGEAAGADKPGRGKRPPRRSRRGKGPRQEAVPREPAEATASQASQDGKGAAAEDQPPRPADVPAAATATPDRDEGGSGSGGATS